MSNPVIEEQLLVCEVFQVYFDLETQETLKKMVPSIARFQPFPSLKTILTSTSNPAKSPLISENLSILDQALFERLSSPKLNIYETLFAIIHRVNEALDKMWNQTPSRSKILKEIQEISENYLTTAFTMPDMFPDGVIALKTTGFENFKQVLSRKKTINSKQLLLKLQSENYTKETAEKAIDFLRLISKIENPNIYKNLFDSCCESNKNFSIGKYIKHLTKK